jgi:hypothetical protein
MEKYLQVMVRLLKGVSAWVQFWCYNISQFLLSATSEVKLSVAINVFTGETLRMAAASSTVGNPSLRWDFRNSQ